eukprot:9519413-Alexandrium_andersonii.AAC.1
MATTTSNVDATDATVCSKCFHQSSTWARVVVPVGDGACAATSAKLRKAFWIVITTSLGETWTG